MIYYIRILIVSFFLQTSLLSTTQARSLEEWIDQEFSQSTLTRDEKFAELQWFKNAAKPFRGMKIKVISERIDTHWYEANTLTKAFRDITGIKIIHELTGEDDVIKKLESQSATGENYYDMYVNDSDLIGTHYRTGNIVPLSDFMQGEGKNVTLPSLDLDDFIGIQFTTAPNGKLYQLPDQQFANLYWYRADWFAQPELKNQFKSIYGYNLNVPLNWSAYEDIAEFFSVYVKEIDGVRIYGHMDYGKRDPSIGWRFSDAWLSMAGMGDKGLPNGLPVDDWGIRVENCKPVGASVRRGGALNGPVAVYGVRKYIEWLEKYAPPNSAKMNFSQSGSWPGKGRIAQQIFWYTAFTASLTKPGLPVVNEDGTPKWRMAPSPKGAYWQDGMKLGYQDVGAWTMLKNTPLIRRKAAWLYAQFTVSKTVSLKKATVGLTFIRLSDIMSDQMTKLAPKLGGLIEFYRSSARNSWTPTGTNVPDYPKLSTLWWQNIPLAAEGSLSPQAAMDKLANAMDSQLAEIEKSSNGKCAPSIGDYKSRDHWLAQPGAPKHALASEKPPGRTATYEDVLKMW